MISHDRAQALISARYDSLLSPEEMRALQEHLQSCAACRQFAHETDLLAQGLRTLPQLPPSPRVTQGVLAGIETGRSPWGWLGRGFRIATSPAMAVASSLVLVAALAFIIVLALRPLGIDEQPRATISALADVTEGTETPTAVPSNTPEPSATSEPTTAAMQAPTQEPTREPAATEITITTSETSTPSPTPAVVVEPTPEPTDVPQVAQILATEEPETIETPEPTEEPVTPIERGAQALLTREPAATTPNDPIEAASEAATEEPDETPPPILPAADAGQPFAGDDELTVADESDEPPALPQSEPAIVPGSGPPEGDSGVAGETTVPSILAEPTAEEPVAVTEEPGVAATDQAEPEPEPATEVVEEPPAEPTATAGPPIETNREPAEAPVDQLEEMQGRDRTRENQAQSMDGESMAASIQATVQAGVDAGINRDESAQDRANRRSNEAEPELATTEIQPVETPPEAPPAEPEESFEAEITGAPATDAETVDEPIAGDETVIEPEPAPVEAPEAGPVVEEAPVEEVAAPDWALAVGNAQQTSNLGFLAVNEGGGVAVYGPDGGLLDVVGGGAPEWDPSGGRLLVIGLNGQGAVWDGTTGQVTPVEPAPVPARDVTAGWYGGAPVVHRVYADGRAELRVVPADGSGGYALWAGSAASLFGEGVTAAKLSPDGTQVAYISGGQLYVAPITDPTNAAPASTWW